MPKISKKSFTIDGKYQEFDLYYSTKEGFYLKDFPAEIWKSSKDGIAPQTVTERACVEAAQAAIDAYHDLKKTLKKVIVVELDLGLNFRSVKETGRGWSGYLPHITRAFGDKIGGRSGRGVPLNGLGLDYEIAWLEHANGSALYSHTDDGKVGCKINMSPSKAILIDYTPEREEFLKSAIESLGKLAEGLVMFFQRSEDELGALIDERHEQLINGTIQKLIG